MSFNQAVARLVRAALEYGRTRIGTDPQYNSLPPRVQQVSHACDHLHLTRNSSQRVSSLELASAENYMFARWDVASGARNRTQMRLETYAYFNVKVAILNSPVVVAGWPIGLLFSWENNPGEYFMRSNPDIPTTRPDAGVLDWGLRGADAGEQDRLDAGVPEAGYQFPEEAYGYSHTYR